MKVVRSLDRVPRKARGAVLVLGAFDGLHIGHMLLVRWAVRHGRETGRPVHVVTFANHPDQVLKGRTPERLTTDAEREALLAAEGVDGLVVLEFSPRMAAWRPEEFLEALWESLRPSAVCVGSNFRFGAGGRGTPEVLRRFLEARGGHVEVMPVLVVGGLPVSSSRIRRLVRRGRVEEAAKLLGRPYAVAGRVVRGEGRGRRLGFPTANLDPGAVGKLLPRHGVYATEARPAGERRWWTAVTFVGPRFRTGVLCLETHIPGWRKDLRGRGLEVRFLRFLRPPRRFRTAEELSRAIGEDVSTVKEAMRWR